MFGQMKLKFRNLKKRAKCETCVRARTNVRDINPNLGKRVLELETWEWCQKMRRDSENIFELHNFFVPPRAKKWPKKKILALFLAMKKKFRGKKILTSFLAPAMRKRKVYPF